MVMMKYDAKCVGIDCVQMDEKGEFQIILRIDDVPRQQLELWKERLFKDIKINIERNE